MGKTMAVLFLLMVMFVITIVLGDDSYPQPGYIHKWECENEQCEYCEISWKKPKPVHFNLCFRNNRGLYTTYTCRPGYNLLIQYFRGQNCNGEPAEEFESNQCYNCARVWP